MASIFTLNSSQSYIPYLASIKICNVCQSNLQGLIFCINLLLYHVGLTCQFLTTFFIIFSNFYCHLESLCPIKYILQIFPPKYFIYTFKIGHFVINQNIFPTMEMFVSNRQFQILPPPFLIS
jgi:hypothetical protein